MSPRAEAPAKASRPRLPRVLRRPRLFRLLDRACQRPLVWISGPAGSGKTTLAASYLGARRLRSLWYRVDEGDGDVAGFFHGLKLAADVFAPGGSRPLPLFTPEYQSGLGAFARRYFEQLSSRLPRRCAFVLDNYQNVPQEAALHEVVGEAATVLPRGVNLFLLSRGDVPEALARPRASRLVSGIGWDSLRLTLRESAGIARLAPASERPPRRALPRLHRMARGWAAGLVLLLEWVRTKGAQPPASLDSAGNSVFAYLATEIFKAADLLTQRFLLLSSFLPSLSEQEAERLTGYRGAGEVLELLHRQNFLIEKGGVRPVRYRYHPLLRAFLLRRAREALPAAEAADHQRRAALLLAERGDAPAAAELLAQAEDWPGLRALILERAPALVAQGRGRTLAAWVDALPAPRVGADPWLLYWKAVAELPLRPPQARELLTRAFALFRREQDPVGACLAWAGAVATFIVEFAPVPALDDWVSRFHEMEPDLPARLSPEVECRVATSMFFALAYRQTEKRAEISHWAERALTLARQVDDTGHQMLTASFVADYCCWTGDLQRAAVVVDFLVDLSRAHKADPVLDVLAKLLTSAVTWHSGRLAESLAAVRAGLNIALKNELTYWANISSCMGASVTYCSGDLAAADEFLELMRPISERLGGHQRSHYHYLVGCIALARGDLPRAREHVEICHRQETEMGVGYSQSLVRHAMAEVLGDLGEDGEARRWLDEAAAVARRQGLRTCELMCAMTEARFCIKAGEEAPGLEALRHGLAIGRETGLFLYPWWRRDKMAELYGRALEHDIERGYVREAIRRLRVEPPRSVVTEQWPFEVKVLTLGRFEVLREEKPLVFSRKAQRRPLELLKALVAFGGRDVAEAQLADALWPDSEGDAAQRTLTTNLHRLRRLLDSERAITVGDRLVSFNPKVVWLDVWGLERLFERIESRLANETLTAEQGSRLARQLLQTYRGTFLAGEVDRPWTAALRERLRSRFVANLGRLGRLLEKEGRFEEVEGVYRRGVEAEELAESFYQGLMRSHLSLGRGAEAMAVYDRCRKVLARDLGIEPSAETRALREQVAAPPG